MEAVFSCMTSSGCQEKGVHQVASLKNSEIFLSKKAGSPRNIQLQCSYSLYDHSQELEKAAEVARPLKRKKCCTSFRPA